MRKFIVHITVQYRTEKSRVFPGNIWPLLYRESVNPCFFLEKWDHFLTVFFIMFRLIFFYELLWIDVLTLILSYHNSLSTFYFFIFENQAFKPKVVRKRSKNGCDGDIMRNSVIQSYCCFRLISNESKLPEKIHMNSNAIALLLRNWFNLRKYGSTLGFRVKI